MPHSLFIRRVLGTVLFLLAAGTAAADDQPTKDAIARYCKDLKDVDAKVRKQAAVELGKLGVKAKSAIPELLAVYRDPDDDVKEAATRALGKIGTEALPAIRRALTDKDLDLRHHALSSLAFFDPAVQEIYPPLTALLKDPSAIGETAAFVLAVLGEPGIRILLQAATDKDPKMRCRIAAALSEAKGKPKEAAAALIQALQDQEPKVRQAAAKSLIWYGPRAEAAVPFLIKALREQEIQEVAPDALARIGPAAVQPVIEALRDKEPAVQLGACRALELMGPKRSLSYASPDDLPMAPLKLQPAVQPLVEMLKAKEWKVRMTAADTLRALGDQAGAAEAALILALKDESDGVRRAAAFALRDIEPRTDAVIAPLIAALQDKFDAVRHGAAQALGSMGPKAKAAVPTLIPLLQDKAVWVPSAAAQALGEIRAEPRKSVPALVAALKGGGDSVLRWKCLDALGQFGEEAREAVPVLLQLLKDKDSGFSAARALNRIDSEAAKKAGVFDAPK